MLYRFLSIYAKKRKINNAPDANAACVGHLAVEEAVVNLVVLMSPPCKVLQVGFVCH